MNDARVDAAVTEAMTGARPCSWLCRIQELLAIRSQFVLSANIRDLFLVPVEARYELMSIVDSLWFALKARGIPLAAVYDKVDGMRLYPNTSEARDDFRPALPEQLELPEPYDNLGPETLLAYLRSAVCSKSIRCGFIIDYASRLIVRPGDLSASEVDFFARCAKLANVAEPLRREAGSEAGLFNPIFWLFDHAEDVPAWFCGHSNRVYPVVVPKPNFTDRIIAAELLLRRTFGMNDIDVACRQTITNFAQQTEGLSLRDLQDICHFAQDQRIPVASISDAISRYRQDVMGDTPTLDPKSSSKHFGPSKDAESIEAQALHPSSFESGDVVNCPHADCEKPNSATAEHCYYCNRPLAGPMRSADRPIGSARPCAELQWPWGTMTLLNSLQIGRSESFSPLAAMLAEDRYISRCHAEIGLEGERFYAIDLGSRCGTYINGTRISRRKKTFIDRSATIQFGRAMTVVVTVKSI